MAVTKYLNPNYSEGGSEPKYLSVPSLIGTGNDNNSYILKLEQFADEIGTVDVSIYNELKEAAESNKIIIIDSDDGNYNYVAGANINNGRIDLEFVINLSYIRLSIQPNGGYVLEQDEVCLNNYVLVKTNTTEFTPTGDYNPATKKYVDDLTNIANIINIDISTILNGGTINFTLPDNNHLYYLLCLKGLNDAGGNYYLPLMRYDTSEFKNYGYDGLIVGNTGNNQYYKNNNIYRISIGTNAGSLEATLVISKYINILTESEYSALGTTSETDNVLYFVTPD